jgi:hypothetical protein
VVYRANSTGNAAGERNAGSRSSSALIAIDWKLSTNEAALERVGSPAEVSPVGSVIALRITSMSSDTVTDAYPSVYQ